MRNAKRDRSSAIPPENLFERPDMDVCEQDEYFVELDPDYQVVERIVTHENRMVYFALILVRVGPTRHTQVYSVDTGHGYLHEHTHGHQRPNDRKDVAPLFSQTDVQESWEAAYRLVMERYSKLEET